MRCKKCGKEIKENIKFCPYCGSMIDVIEADRGTNEKTKTGEKRKIIFIVIIGVLIVAMGCALVISLKEQKTKKQYMACLDNGNKYLKKMDYEKAEESFLKAIKVNPKRKEPYIKLSDIYLANNEVEKARAIVEKAEKNVPKSEKQQFTDLKKDWENLENYEWVVKPEIEADDIYYLRDNQEIAYSQNEIKRQKFSDYAIIEKDQKRGLIKNDGTIVDGIKYTMAFVLADVDKGTPYILTDPDTDETFYLDEETGKMKNVDDWKSIDLEWRGGTFYYAEGIHNILDVCEEVVSDGEKMEVPSCALPVRQAENKLVSRYDFTSWLHELKEEYAIYYNNNLSTDFIYEECGSESSGLLAVKKDGKWGYANEKGEIVIPTEYDSSWNNYSPYNLEEPEVLELPQYPYCYAASEGYVPLIKDGKWEMRNTSGKLVIASGVFEKICPVYDGKCWVKKDGKWGVIQLKNAKDDSWAEKTAEKIEQKKAKLSQKEETIEEAATEETAQEEIAQEDNSTQLTKEEIAQLVVEHYNALLPEEDGGNYAIFDPETQDTESGYSMILRYQMSEEEANEIIAEGGSPSANRLVAFVEVNIQSGEVTTDTGDAWNLY